MSGPVIDVHAHAILGDVEAAVAGQPGLAASHDLDARRNGPESLAVSAKMVGQRIAKLTELDPRLADMDSAGVDVQVLSPSPSHYHYWADPALAQRICRTANHGIADLVAQRPTRFTGLGLVPLQHPDLMVELLEHAVSQCGLVGVEIGAHAGTSTGTVELSDSRLDPFWARAADLAAVVFLHPFGCTLDERLDRFYLSNTVGQPVENAVALSHLIFGGVLDRHPRLRLVAAHGGGYLPTFLGRADHAWQVRPDARGCMQTPSSYLRQLWFDSLVHTPDALRALIAAAGADRVLLGSDYPFDMGVADPVERVRAAGVNLDTQQTILGKNAVALGLAPRPVHPLAPAQTHQSLSMKGKSE